jgi:hypothetical protein
MIIVFDTWGGLCNQFYDINCGINFCIANNFKFTFRNCAFRNKNMVSWTDEPFDKLFDISSIIERYKYLYINPYGLELTDDNTHNINGNLANHIFSNNYIEELGKIKKEYVILKLFWSLNAFSCIVDHNIYSEIKPSERLLVSYNKLKDQLLINNEKYNFIHYRYESDFTQHFRLKVEPLKDLILKLKNSFKESGLKIYIATSSIRSVINLDDDDVKDIIFTKNEDELKDYNFEELAFIDYMFGLNSNEVYGHRNSSFSVILNALKGTNNFYA